MHPATVKDFIKWLKDLKMDDFQVLTTQRIAFKEGYLNGNHKFFTLNGTSVNLANVKNFECLILEVEPEFTKLLESE